MVNLIINHSSFTIKFTIRGLSFSSKNSILG